MIDRKLTAAQKGAGFETCPLLRADETHTAPLHRWSRDHWPSWLHTIEVGDEDWTPDPAFPMRSCELIIVVARTKHRAALSLTDLQARLTLEVGRAVVSPVVNPNSATKPNAKDYFRFKTPQGLFTAARLFTDAGVHEAVDQLRETTMMDLRPRAMRLRGDGRAQKAAWPEIYRTAVEGAESEAANTSDSKLRCGASVAEYAANLVLLREAVLAEYLSFSNPTGEEAAQ